MAVGTVRDVKLSYEKGKRTLTTRVTVPSQRSSVSHFVPRTVAALFAPWVLKRPCESLPQSRFAGGRGRRANDRETPAARSTR